MSKDLQLYHLKQYFTAAKNDLCNNDLSCNIESSKEGLSNNTTANNQVYKNWYSGKQQAQLHLVKKKIHWKEYGRKHCFTMVTMWLPYT